MNFFKFIGVLCFESSFRIQEFVRKFFDFWRLENFLRKSRRLKKNEIFEKKFMNCLRIHFYLANYCLLSPHKFAKCNLPINIVLCRVFVPMILKILLYNINNKRPTKWVVNYEWDFVPKCRNSRILWGIFFFLL